LARIAAQLIRLQKTRAIRQFCSTVNESLPAASILVAAEGDQELYEADPAMPDGLVGRRAQ
jgi:hypothetical protein